MNIIHNIKSYINENELKITILKNKINIESDRGDIIISGKNLVVSKLVDDEVLITGDFYNMEFR